MSYDERVIATDEIVGFDLVGPRGNLDHVGINPAWGVFRNGEQVHFSQTTGLVLASLSQFVNRPVSTVEFDSLTTSFYIAAMKDFGADDFRQKTPQVTASERHSSINSLKVKVTSPFKPNIFKIGNSIKSNSWIFFCDNAQNPEYGQKKLEDFVSANPRYEPMVGLMIDSYLRTYNRQVGAFLSSENARISREEAQRALQQDEPRKQIILAQKREEKKRTRKARAEVAAKHREEALAVISTHESVAASDLANTGNVEQAEGPAVTMEPELNRSQTDYLFEVEGRVRNRVEASPERFGWLFWPQTMPITRVIMDILMENPKRAMDIDTITVLVAEKFSASLEEVQPKILEGVKQIVIYTKRPKGVRQHPMGRHINLQETGHIAWNPNPDRKF